MTSAQLRATRGRRTGGVCGFATRPAPGAGRAPRRCRSRPRPRRERKPRRSFLPARERGRGACAGARSCVRARVRARVRVARVRKTSRLTGGRQHVLDEYEDGLLGAQLDALADDIHKLAHGQVGGDLAGGIKKVSARRGPVCVRVRARGCAPCVRARHCTPRAAKGCIGGGPHARAHCRRSPGPTRYFFLSMSGISDFSAFSTITW